MMFNKFVVRVEDEVQQYLDQFQNCINEAFICHVYSSYNLAAREFNAKITIYYIDLDYSMRL